TGGDLVPLPGRLRITRVVVQVTGQGQHQLRLPWAQDRAFEEQQVPVGVRGVALLHPGWLRRAQDHLVARLHVRGHFGEVVQLRLVDVRRQLDIDAEQPPALRQFQREVAARLPRLPGTDGAALAEQAHEAGEAVVPVVVARYRKQVRPGRLVVNPR